MVSLVLTNSEGQMVLTSIRVVKNGWEADKQNGKNPEFCDQQIKAWSALLKRVENLIENTK